MLVYITKCSCNRLFSWSVPAGKNGIIAGVFAALSILLVIISLTIGLMCCKKDSMDNYISKR